MTPDRPPPLDPARVAEIRDFAIRNILLADERGESKSPSHAIADASMRDVPALCDGLIAARAEADIWKSRAHEMLGAGETLSGAVADLAAAREVADELATALEDVRSAWECSDGSDAMALRLSSVIHNAEILLARYRAAGRGAEGR